MNEEDLFLLLFYFFKNKKNETLIFLNLIQTPNAPFFKT